MAGTPTVARFAVLAGILAVPALAAAQAPPGSVWQTAPGAVPRPVGVRGVAIAAATVERFALDADGTVRWWTFWGRSPAPVPDLDDVAAIAATEHCLWSQPPFPPPPGRLVAARRDGTVWEWTDGAPPIPVAGLSDVVALSALGHHVLALTASGAVWTWNPCGVAPRQVSGLPDITAVAAGRAFGLALAPDGTLWGWGANDVGQLGDGTNLDRPDPVRVGTLTDVVAVAAGQMFGMALTADGRAWRWGGLDWYRDCSDSTRWPVPLASRGAAIGAGLRNGYVIKRDGSTWAWGSNRWGELGDGGEWGSCELVKTRLHGTVAATSTWFGAVFLAAEPQLASVAFDEGWPDGCATAAGVVSLTGPVPRGTLSVALSTDVAGVAVPPIVRFREGHRFARVVLEAAGPAPALPLTVRAEAPDGAVREATVLPSPMRLAEAWLTPREVRGGQPASLALVLPCAAPRDVVVALASSRPAAAAPREPAVVVPAGAQAVLVPLDTREVAKPTAVRVSAALGGTMKSVRLVLTP